MSVVQGIMWLLMAAASITIAYQDLRERAISWWTVLLLVVAAVMLPTLSVGFKPAFTTWSINVLILVFQFGLVAVMFALGRRKWNFFDHLIGWGDILFLLALSALFSTSAFLVFYCTSLVLTLIGFGTYRLFSRKEGVTIPLAGAISICLMAFVPALYYLGYEPWDELPLYQWLP
ncbi:MAG: hypothetical protein GC178_01820 [Flavobacteriales bacterium]|nr:hypothetical protein [Flavobacteriales bacterium]